MKFTPKAPPRTFSVGKGGRIAMADCGRMELAPDEQVTFTTPSGAEYDVARKVFGFYATPSTNARLAGFGLRAALVAGDDGKRFVMLMEEGREREFAAYLAQERLAVDEWLDAPPAGSPAARARCVCGSRRLAPHFSYDAPPAVEPDYGLDPAAYSREFLRCERCGHFLAAHRMDLSELYAGTYSRVAHAGADGLAARFARILALPPEASDNAGRVERVAAFAAQRFAGRAPGEIRVLDVGSGLAVFGHAMARRGFACTGLDPDPEAARHARETAGIAAVAGDFMEADDLGRFEMAAFNKVLEHVLDPSAMLARARKFLAPGGVAYVEVPDGEEAARLGPKREEFTVDHWHAFSPASLAVLAARAGFRLLRLERLATPSGKRDLTAFLEPLEEQP